MEPKKQYYHSKSIAILMKSPENGGCHACGGLTSQTLLYCLGCLGLIPTSALRWGELAGTETAFFLEEFFGLSYSSGRAEQFLSSCVYAIPGCTEEKIENRICKWTRSIKKQKRDEERNSKLTKKDSSVPFRDAIWPNQNLYHPVEGMLSLFSAKFSRTIRPPAYDWPHVRGKRAPGETVFWDQKTQSTKKRVLGNNHRKKSRSEKIVVLTWKQMQLLPSKLEVILQFGSHPLYLSINNLLGFVLEEKGPVPNKRLIACRLSNRPGYRFALNSSTNDTIHLKGKNLGYSYAKLCISEGGLRFALNTSLQLSSQFIINLLHSHHARRQLRNRNGNPTGEYFILYDNNARKKGKRMVLAIAIQISRLRFVLCLFNDRYQSASMDYFYLDHLTV